MNSKTSVGSKVLTIAFCTLMVLLTIAAFVYLSVGPDFLTPAEYQQLYGTTAPTGSGDPNEPIDLSAEYEKALWDAEMQDLLDYLQELGYIDQENIVPMSTIGTDNWICDGLDLIWWDVENLEKGTEAYDYWQEYQENGFIIFGGEIYVPTANGPFAVNILSQFEGNEKRFLEDYMNFGKYLYEKEHGGEPVDLSAEYEKALWNAAMQDLLDYLLELGHIEESDIQGMAELCTEGHVCKNGLDLLWWDVDNLVEGTAEYDYWQEYQENGFIIYAGVVYAPTGNGPFAVKVLSKFEGNEKQFLEDFMNFGKYLYEKNNS